jgi:hypothetical protein
MMTVGVSIVRAALGLFAIGSAITLLTGPVPALLGIPPAPSRPAGRRGHLRDRSTDRWRAVSVRPTP